MTPQRDAITRGVIADIVARSKVSESRRRSKTTRKLSWRIYKISHLRSSYSAAGHSAGRAEAMARMRASFSSVMQQRHRPFRCEVCHYTSSSRWHLKRHQMIHTGEKPFKCHLCPMTFALKHNMATHMRTHTGERPFRCEICPRTFSQQQGLKKHAIQHTYFGFNSSL
ncbi:uncharacterized protein LOC142771619 [Rhipicephalus microplus]|uniref:uncharacterized protein LOC142771619 n=1 Tax=Rhipicephalus microplus TaxID=6941 RepID=UPI003F6B4D7E